MNNKKQSSVEWLFNKLVLMNPNLIGFGDYLEQAKAMHEEETINAWMDGDARIPEEVSRKEAEYYYNKTFGDQQ